MTEEKIMTRHPAGKSGVNILKRRYEIIKSFILEVLEAHPNITFKDLSSHAVVALADSFDGKIMWYITTVKLDLEARGDH